MSLPMMTYLCAGFLLITGPGIDLCFNLELNLKCSLNSSSVLELELKFEFANTVEFRIATVPLKPLQIPKFRCGQFNFKVT